MSNVEEILTKVFSPEPAEPRTTYIQSRPLDARYTLLNASGVLERTYVTGDYQAPDWLDEVDFLGAYEKNFLVDCLDFGGRLIAYRSGSGSGKSSLVLALDSACKLVSETRNWKNDYGCNTFFSHINIQSVGECGLRANIEPEELTSYIKKTCTLLSNHLREALFKTLGNNNEDAIKFLRRVSKNLTQTPYIVVNTLAEFSKSLNSSDSDGNKWINFVNLINQKDPEDRFELLYCLFGCLATFYPSNRNHIVCIDNTDQLHHVLLNHMMIRLQGLIAQYVEFKNLKVVLFMRLSTANDQINAFPPAWFREFSSPDPIALTLVRAIEFIFSDNKNFKIYEKNLINDAKFRVSELVFTLLDDVKTFQTGLECMAGTNIRNCLLQAIKWCNSESLIPRIDNTKDLDAGLLSIKQKYLGSSIVNLYRGYNQYLAKSINSYGNKSDHRWSRTISNKLRESFTEMTRRAGHNESGMDRFVRNTLLIELEEENELSTFCKHAFSDGALQDSVNQIRKSVNNKSASIQDRFNLMLTKLQQDGCGCDEGDLIAKAVIAKYIDHIKGWLENPADFKPHTSVLNQTARFPDPDLSRFDRISLLFNAELHSSPISLRPINLFATDNLELSACSLRILYLVGEVQDNKNPVSSVLFQDLQKNCLYAGYNIEEFNKSMRQLTDHQNRLIYSTVADHHAFKNSEDSSKFFWDKPFYISWAGMSYFEKFCFNPTYIAFQLGSVKEIRKKFSSAPLSRTEKELPSYLDEEVIGQPFDLNYSLMESQKNIIRALAGLFDHDRRTRNNADPEKIYLSELEESISPIYDCIFRAAPQLIDVLMYYLERAAKARILDKYDEKRREILETMKDLQSLLIEIEKDSKETFNRFRNDWDATINYIHKKVDLVEKGGKLENFS